MTKAYYIKLIKKTNRLLFHPEEIDTVKIWELQELIRDVFYDTAPREEWPTVEEIKEIYVER